MPFCRLLLFIRLPLQHPCFACLLAFFFLPSFLFPFPSQQSIKKRKSSESILSLSQSLTLPLILSALQPLLRAMHLTTRGSSAPPPTLLKRTYFFLCFAPLFFSDRLRMASIRRVYLTAPALFCKDGWAAVPFLSLSFFRGKVFSFWRLPGASG